MSASERAEHSQAPWRATVGLDGPWRVRPADEDLRRRFVSPDFDDSSWPEVAVPGPWRDCAELAASDGPVLYRRSVEVPDEEAFGSPRRTWLCFDGIMGTSDIWLDGSYLADTEGYFSPCAVETTGLLSRGSSHRLALEVACPAATGDVARSDLLGAFAEAGPVAPEANSGGLFGPVSLQSTGPVRITRLRVVCREARPDGSTVEITAVLDSDTAGSFAVTTRLGASELDRQEHTLAAGENHLTWHVTTGAALWWPKGLGRAELHDLRVDVTDPEGRPSDSAGRRLGLRSCEFRRGRLRVNGERVFARGLHVPPLQDRDQARRWVSEAVGAGANILRLEAHVAVPELYDAADEAGMLIWQDMPLPPIAERSTRQRARRMATDMVDVLAQHPSVVVWCGRREPRRSAAGDVLAGALPTWNRAVLDRAVAKALRSADPSRPVVATSGGLGTPAGRRDTHLRLETSSPDGGVARMARLWPAQVTFVGELDLGDEPAALVARRAVETLRRLKDRPCGGVLGPSAGAGLVPADLGGALAPLLVTGDAPPAVLGPGAEVTMELHVVNDGPPVTEPCRLSARVSAGEGSGWQRMICEQIWTGEVAGDAVTHIGRLAFVAPEAVRPAELRIRLELTGPGVAVSNEYMSCVDDGN